MIEHNIIKQKIAQHNQQALRRNYIVYLHVPSIWYVVEDRPKILHGIHGVDLLQVGFVLFGSRARNSSVKLQ